MSRIGKRLINIPSQVTVSVKDQVFSAKGPKGELSQQIPLGIQVVQQNDCLVVERVSESLLARKLHGLCRTLVSNLVEGVFQGFERRLEIQGVGYRAQMDGKKLVLNIGFSHPVIIEPPTEIQLQVENNTNIIVKGINKELVGKLAAKIRSVRPPEPYKGKGIRYVGENVKRKVGKAGKK
uniref:Large ribosomal subunit protein uL6c n=1 Tax=Cyanophora sudae TaxID=1522369 RepID=A0A2Z4HG86_9EUKA|nr:ribosomal protein L6 [Cyanophora sudae]AWW13663.1 ribosomal protein L6 [Cyanophora sudae]